MNNFRFTKIVASVSPILAKETVLSKIINMVDAFTLTLSRGFDDNNKKYIDTLMKLDNSKTVILETKWNEVRIKNIGNFNIKVWQKVVVEYSEYTQENEKKIYIDYPNMDLISIGSQIKFVQSGVVLKVEKSVEDTVECTVTEAKEKHIFQYDRCLLEHNEDPIETLLERDEKDILWWLEYWVHIISMSACYSAEHIQATKDFLKEKNNWDMKVFAKIETRKWLDNLQEIVDVADGIILVADFIEPLLSKEETLDDLVQYIRWKGVPVLMNYACRTSQAEYPFSQEEQLQHRCGQCVDGVCLEPMIIEDEVFDAIEKYNGILKCPDQDILNCVLGGKCLMLPVRNNYQHHMDRQCRAENGLVIHYIWKKPWNADYPGYLDKPFWKEAAACGFGREYRKYRRQRKMDFYKNELIPAAKAKLKRKKWAYE